MADIKGTQADIQRVRQLEKEREKKKQELDQRKQKVAAEDGGLVSIST